MKAARKIPDAVGQVQRQASDPQRSAWVSANAGSGKTYVLTQRVIRLLLAGTDPGRILCITFTKAAATTMANRVFETLRTFIAMEDAALDLALRGMGVKPDKAMRARARQLFAIALETPGGLKVQTIHAFCTNLLHLFPFEANVAARFNVLEEAAERDLLSRLTLETMLQAAGAPNDALGRALAVLITSGADQTIRDLLDRALAERMAITHWLAHAGSLDRALHEVAGALGVQDGDTRAAIEAQMLDGPHLPPSEWASIAAACATGSSSDCKQGERLRDAARLTGTARLDCYLDIFLTGKNEPRQAVLTAALAKREAALARRFTDEAARLNTLLARRAACSAFERTAALLTIAVAVIEKFRAEKDRRGLLDFGDLIEKSLVLLTDQSSAWVHYKLDRGIDHVLIDEAQDTSPEQWAIVRALVAEFFAGEGARPGPRTIFAVGDEKQSIFSFQGADPSQFDENRRLFDRLHRDASREFDLVRLHYSFRSGPNVLGAVDAVFALPDARRGLSADALATVHEHLPDAAPGLVELWPLEMPNTRDKPEPWDAPFDVVSEDKPPVRLARRIARTIKGWQSAGRRAGDVLILVRRRGVLFEAIIRALKQAGVPVAGADRLKLAEHIAVMDLIALADALLLPQDDLALATVLRSPLFGFTDEQLYTIAYQREGVPLRTMLRGRTDSPFKEAALRLDDFALRARHETPFAFYARLLGADGARRAFLQRFGAEANDALDEFLNRALDHERLETPSLQGFAQAMRGADTEVKRDMELDRDEVRVMTVHGAKGLEAPIVILADTTGVQPPRRGLIPMRRADGTPDRFVWAGRSAEDAPAVAAARAAIKAEDDAEYRRLLYVAMTRAMERLIVCGAEPGNARPAGCWYDLVKAGLGTECVEEPADDGAGTVQRFRKAPAETPAAAPPRQGELLLDPAGAPPVWLTTPAHEPQRHAPLTPSRAAHATPPRRSTGENAAIRMQARRRGTLVHRLLQSLPDVPGMAREAAARDFLSRRAGDFPEAERDAIAKRLSAILSAAPFAPLFAAGSRAEAPIVGHVAGRRISGGVIDRLVVTPELVLIADYKTDRTPPLRIEDAPQGYIAQLALYRAVLAELYPGRTMRAALLWTETPALMEVPAALLDAALAEVLAQA